MNDLIAIIPARSGSKGISNKNIMNFQGKPLFAHSIDYALKSLPCSHIFFSSDSSSYCDMAMSYGLKESNVILRPSCISEDIVVDYPVALHSWIHAYNIFNDSIKYIVWLRPTSPVRPPGLIEAARSLYLSTPNADSVRAVRTSTEHPFRQWQLGDGDSPFIQPIFNPPSFRSYEIANIPRQLIPDNYFYQSGEIELFTPSLLQSGTISGTNILPLVMDCINPDIDELNDLL